jgi:hypothetical protein
MAFDYHWWSLENSELKGLLYNSIGNFWLHDHPYKTWGELEADLPHMAYAQHVYSRFDMLEQLFVDLRVVVQMLGVTELPIKSTVMPINRYDWLKSVLDLKLIRFSTIRDASFFLVNEVLELHIDDLKLNLKSIRKVISSGNPNLIIALEKINIAGSNIRDERNLRAHKGFSDLTTEDDQMFKNISWAEAYGSRAINYDIENVYNQAAQQIYDRLIRETENLVDKVIELVDLLVEDFETRFAQKRQLRAMAKMS